MSHAITSRWTAWCRSVRVAGTAAAAFLILGATAASAQTRVTTRASTASSGVEATGSGAEGGHSLRLAVSADGRFVAFLSDATNVVPNDTNLFPDVFVKDRATDTTTRVSVSSAGAQANDSSSYGGYPSIGISADGRYVVFTSLASNLVAADNNRTRDVFRHDRQTGQTVRVSVSAEGVEADRESAFPSISADGRYVSFASMATNIFPGVASGIWQIYRKDLVDGTLHLVSQDTPPTPEPGTVTTTVVRSPVPGNATSGRTAISADGRYVAFESAASNLAGAGVTDTNDWDIFVHDTAGKTKTVRVSVRSDGTKTAVVNNFGAWQPVISGNGRFIAFGQDETGLVPEDTNGIRDIYVHDRDTDRDGVFDEPGAVATFRASPGATGQSDGASFLEHSALSFDGRYLTFNSTATTLTVGEADPSGNDTFVVDLNRDGDTTVGEPGDLVTTRVSITTQGVMQSGSGAEPAISADGRFIVFNSFAAGLVANDTNGVGDTFVHDLFALAVSTAGSGTESALNGDGRYLVFESADPLVQGDTNGVSDIYVRDRAKQTVLRLSLSTVNLQANGGSFKPVISKDGRFVAFESDATNLIGDDTNGTRDVFLRDRDADGDGVFDEPGGTTTTLVSRSVGGAAGRGASSGASISADGLFIAFSSAAPNLIFNDSNGLTDVFVRQRNASNATALTRVNLGPAGAQAAGGDSTSARISGNGRYVAFASAATNLVDGASEGGADSNGAVDVFRHDRFTGATVRVNLTSAHGQSSGPAADPAINGSGDLVAFVTATSLVSKDTNTFTDVYTRAIGSHTTTLESISGTGAVADNHASEPALNEEGRVLLFTSLASNLSLLDTNGVSDVYVRDRLTGNVRVASVVGTRVFTTASHSGAVSADGRTVAYSTVDGPASLRGNGLTMATATGISITTQSEPASLDVSVSLSPASAPVNQTQEVQISGTGLSGVTDVYFGATPGTGLQLVNDGLLLVTAPASADAGAVHVQLSYGNGVGSVLRPNAFEYLAAGDPTPVCEVTLSANTTTVQQSGGPVSLTVTAPAACTWRAENTVEWIAVGEPAASDGTKSVQVTVEANDNPAERKGKIIVARQEVELTQQGQGCTTAFTLNTHHVDIDAVEVSDDHIAITIAPGCAWTASSSDTSWLQVGNGSGPATVFFTTSVNTSPFERTVDITIAGVGGPNTEVVRVTQAGIPPPGTCSYVPTPPATPMGPVMGATAQITISTPPGSTCPWSASTDESWIEFPSGATGTNSGTLTVRAVTQNDGGNRQAVIVIGGQQVTVVQEGPSSGRPFGSLDLAASIPDVNGSIPLTGWALDDQAVTGVEILRLAVAGEPGVEPGSEIFIGTASFVRGARPDVEQLYPGIPRRDLAGWGYLLLTNQLPEIGSGEVTLIFRAWDGPGQWQFSPSLSFDGCKSKPKDCPTRGLEVELGRTVLTLTNKSATAPFGSIDLPAQGQEISGTSYAQWGWVLTPSPKSMTREGIRVIIDGIDRGPLTVYDVPRADVQALFPGRSNSAGPGGYLAFDTTMLSEGVHTIAWVATDSAGAASGIGSRYFSVNNHPDALTSALLAQRSAGDLLSLPAAIGQLQYTRGLTSSPVNARGDGAGVRHVTLRALDILRLPLASHGATVEGYSLTAGDLRALPIGSSLTNGVFAWQLGPGFTGIYDLLFVRTAGGRSERIPVRVVVEPFGADTKQRLVVDAPHAGGEHTSPFTLGGWGMSGGAAGLGEVAVYAYPVEGGDPFFVGTATLGGARADVAAAFGGQFARSGFSLKVESLPAGVYDFLVAARSDVSSALDTAVWVRSVTIR